MCLDALSLQISNESIASASVDFVLCLVESEQPCAEVQAVETGDAELTLAVTAPVQSKDDSFVLAPVTPADVPAATAPSGYFRVMSLGLPLPSQRPAAAPSARPAVSIGAERIYLVEGGVTRSYHFGSMARFAPIRERQQRSVSEAPKSFSKLADAVAANGANIAYGSQYVERNFSVMSVEPPIPEPAAVMVFAVASGVVLVRRRAQF